MAKSEGVAPLIYWAIKGSYKLHSLFDRKAFNILQSSYYATAARNIMLMQELERILKA